MKNTTIVIWTNNPHKLREIGQILEAPALTIVGYKSIYDHIEVIEDGNTFAENALKKVHALPTHPERIYLADDSGLEVEAMDNRPGIYSARYAGENATREEMCQKILADLGDSQNRRARFVCVIALKFPDGTTTTVEGEVRGQIADKMAGDQGFGYDPIFIPDGYATTFAQMTPEDKHGLSHRGQALKAARDKIERVVIKCG